MYRRLWSGYFTLRGLRRFPDALPVHLVFVPGIGGMSGMSVALVVSELMGNTDWVVPLGALGYIDGLLGGTALAIAFAEKSAPLMGWIRLNPFKSATIVIGIAYLCGGQVGA